MSIPQRPQPDDHAPYFQRYVDLVPEEDVLAVLESQLDERRDLIAGLSEAQAGRRYEPGKWSIREIFGHLADTERVFAYRALSIARGETAPLPGFDEDAWVGRAGHDARTLASLEGEWALVRHATLTLLTALDDDAWGRRGMCNDLSTSVTSIPFVIAGHERHHLNVINSRYLG